MPSHHISYFLKQHFGLSFTAYKNLLRAEHAKQLIEEGYLENNTIDALAEECGYASRTSFSKTFKSLINISPSQYASTLN
jgi:AraC-like DNA-binding protein